MATSKKSETMAAAGAGVFDKFFSQTQQEPRISPQKATEEVKVENSTPEPLKGQNEPNLKAKKVFSFRADQEKATSWRAYADARGMKMDQLGAAAFEEYIAAHPLTGADQKQIYDIKVRRAQKQQETT